MLNKVVKYYKIFGLKQTFLKFFRYIDDNMHFDKNGIYQIKKSEETKILKKTKEIYIFSDSQYNEEKIITDISQKFNELGFAINYICTNKITNISKNTPLSTYKEYSEIKDTLKISDKIIIIDTNNREIFDYIKINTKNCFLVSQNKNIDNIDYLIKKNYLKNSFDVCTEIINSFFQEKKCDKEFYDNISVVILNYNNKKVIFNCLDTLIKYNKKYNYEIIVVDNQSIDGSYEKIKDNYKNIKVYQNNKNGCSSGRNIGIKNSTKKYIIFLDSDQWILNENWLDNYIEIFKKNKNVGAIGWTGGFFNNKGYSYHTVNNFIYNYMPPAGLYRNDIGYLGTGGMMTTKNLLNKVGNFDEKYDPTCYEDTDISLKIRNEKKEILYCPYLGVGHLPHQTTNSGSEEHNKLIYEKGTYFVNKWKKINPKLLEYKK